MYTNHFKCQDEMWFVQLFVELFRKSLSPVSPATGREYQNGNDGCHVLNEVHRFNTNTDGNCCASFETSYVYVNINPIFDRTLNTTHWSTHRTD